MDVVLWGLPAAVVVSLLVQGLKTLGMPSRFGAHAALALSVGVAAAIGLARYASSWSWAIELVGVVLMVWLTAIGVYEKGKDLR